MANVCTYTVTLTGTDQENDIVLADLRSRLEKDPHGWHDSIKHENGDFSYVYDIATKSVDGRAEITGEEAWSPGIKMAAGLVARFPTINFHVVGTDEAGRVEEWECTSGVAKHLYGDVKS